MVNKQDTAKLMNRSYLLTALSSPRGMDGLPVEGPDRRKHYRSQLIRALAIITGIDDETYPTPESFQECKPALNTDWLEEKAYQIQKKGLSAFMDYLDEENLDRMMDPSLDLFPHFDRRGC